jgi:hypothetical protein
MTSLWHCYDEGNGDSRVMQYWAPTAYSTDREGSGWNLASRKGSAPAKLTRAHRGVVHRSLSLGKEVTNLEAWTVEMYR